jgi:hypothetical protein
VSIGCSSGIAPDGFAARRAAVPWSAIIYFLLCLYLYKDKQHEKDDKVLRF